MPGPTSPSSARNSMTDAASGISGWCGRQTNWVFHGRYLDTENRILREENARLLEENARLHEADATAQRLRLQIGFAASPPSHKLPADVISVRPNPNFETIVIARGSRDGVRLNSVVVSQLGLVGHIFDVAPTSSAVVLLTDANSSVGAMVQRPESRAIGVCKGSGSSLLSMAYLSREAGIKLGDVIISSGLGGEMGIFPKGVVIGSVTSISSDAAGSTLKISVKPSVNFGRLEEVYVLK